MSRNNRSFSLKNRTYSATTQYKVSSIQGEKSLDKTIHKNPSGLYSLTQIHLIYNKTIKTAPSPLSFRAALGTTKKQLVS